MYGGIVSSTDCKIPAEDQSQQSFNDGCPSGGNGEAAGKKKKKKMSPSGRCLLVRSSASSLVNGTLAKSFLRAAIVIQVDGEY